MTDPPGPPSDTPPPAPDARPIGVGATIGAGCGGFVAFFVALLFIGGSAATANRPLSGILIFVVLALVLVGVFVAAVRNATPRGRGLLVRAAIGFGIAAAVFGSCLAAISGTNFH